MRGELIFLSPGLCYLLLYGFTSCSVIYTSEFCVQSPNICSYRDHIKDNVPLNVSKWLSYFKLLNKVSKPHVTLFGGKERNPRKSKSYAIIRWINETNWKKLTANRNERVPFILKFFVKNTCIIRTSVLVYLTFKRRSADCFIQRPSPYRAVNTFHLGYKNQSVFYVNGTSYCLFSDK
jgi:hypothetical protein